MRKIDKGKHSPLFDDFVSRNSPTNWNDIHAEGYSKKAYEDTKLRILTDEQNQLCGYTELPIKELTNCHIDHYKKRSVFLELTFDWNNLIVATNDDNFGARYKDSMIKKDDYEDIFNPVIDNVENYFYYNIWGEIETESGISDPKKEKVENTIKMFNLNHESLKQRRKSLIIMLEKCGEMAKKDILPAFENSGFLSVINQILELRETT